MNHKEYEVETYYHVPTCACGGDLTVPADNLVLPTDPPKKRYVCSACNEVTTVPEQQWPGIKYRTTGKLHHPSTYAPPTPPPKKEPGESLTYDEWKDLGYHVMRGEKYSGKNASGVPTFSPEQVEEDED